ncbi:hypothetical protein ACKVMT_10260 [Halobacteriales archaeon Cl-PHB]
MNDLRRTLSALMAVLVVTGVVGGAVTFGEELGGPAEDFQDYVVGDAEAAIPLIAGAFVVAGSAAAGYYTAQITDSGASAEELQEADATETEKEIYSRGTTLVQDQETIFTSWDNHLEDTETIARLEGKNAYIRALENGSSESAARFEAKGSVADYYSGRQTTMVASWDTTALTIESMEFTEENTSGVANTFVHPTMSAPTADWTVSFQDFTTTTVQVANGTSIQVQAIKIQTTNTAKNDGWEHKSKTHTLTPLTSGPLCHDSNNGDGCAGDPAYTAELTGIHVKAPNSNYDRLHLVELGEFGPRWTDTENLNGNIQDEMDVFVNNTYADYQQGMFNTSELVDPYLAAREYSPDGDYQAWALRTLINTGHTPPDNLSQFGNMTVASGSQTYTGILLSDGNPPGDTFEVGKTYDTANLTGSQFVLTDSSMQELSGTFSITEATNDDGTSLDQVSYENVTYDTATTEEYQDLQNQLKNLTAQVNAWQQKERQKAAGGGLFNFSLFGLPSSFLLLLAALAAVVLASRS